MVITETVIADASRSRAQHRIEALVLHTPGSHLSTRLKRVPHSREANRRLANHSAEMAIGMPSVGPIGQGASTQCRQPATRGPCGLSSPLGEQMSKRLYLITAALLLLAAVPADAEPRQCAPGQIRVKVSNAAGGKYACVSAAAQKPRKQTCVGKPGPGGSVKLVCT
jgi:hypothetical protein